MNIDSFHHFLLIGHPNTGKSSLFTELSGQRAEIGNRPGVTVERCLAPLKNHSEHYVEDLPGIYYLDPQILGCAADQAVTLQRLSDLRPSDLIVNVIDHRSLRSHLHLTLQLIELGKPIIIVLSFNASEKCRRSLELWLGIPCFLSQNFFDQIHSFSWDLGCAQQPAYLALRDTLNTFDTLFLNEHTPILDNETFLAEKRYELIDGFLKEQNLTQKSPKTSYSDRIDRVMLHRFFGIFIFFAIMYHLFKFTILSAQLCEDFFEPLVSSLFQQIQSESTGITQIIFGSLAISLSSVISFAPSLFILYFLLGGLEQSGYMQRASFVVDRFMQTLKLPGQSFVSIVIGFGCNVPAIMSTRSLNHPVDRLQTMLMSPFMSCSARLAIFTVFSQAFFGAQAYHMIFGLYCLGFFVAILTGLAIRFVFKNTEHSGLVMPYVPYCIPNLRQLTHSAFLRSSEFISKALVWVIPSVALIQLWVHYLSVPDTNWSSFLVSLFAPIGLGEENFFAIVSLIGGLIAKEVLLGTLQGAYGHLSVDELGSVFSNPQSAVSYLIFVLLYFPCVSVTLAIAQESSVFWAVFSAFWSTSLAYCAAFLYYQWSNVAYSLLSKMIWTLLCLLYIFAMIIALKYLVQSDTKGPQLRFRLKNPTSY